MPITAQVAVGRRDKLNVTAVISKQRMVQVAETTIRRWTRQRATWQPSADPQPNLLRTQNIQPRTGRGHTVLEMIRTFEEVSGRPVPL